MSKIAFIFPGQGAQYVGMGQALYSEFTSVKGLYETANNILGFDLANLCFNGPVEELTATNNSQPAILVASIAALIAFRERSGKDITPSACAGLSLGEYSALVAADVISFEDALRLVRVRGEAMQEASRKNPGKMLCIMGLDIPDVEKIVWASGAEIANLNCPGQVVISGSVKSVEAAIALASQKGAKRCIPLEVSGPFHSSLMQSAGMRLKQELDKAVFRRPAIPFVSNVTASFVDDPDDIKDNLIAQVSHKTLWEASIRAMAKEGIAEFYEIGPGTVLKGLLRRIDPSLAVRTINDTTLSEF